MEYEWVQKTYPSIYDSCYEIVANALAAESVYFGKKEEFSEMQAYDKTKELFKDCQLLGAEDTLLIHLWFRRCCDFASCCMDNVINSIVYQN